MTVCNQAARNKKKVNKRVIRFIRPNPRAGTLMKILPKEIGDYVSVFLPLFQKYKYREGRCREGPT